MAELKKVGKGVDSPVSFAEQDSMAYGMAAQCSEALGDRKAAIEYYAKSNQIESSPDSNFTKRFAILQRGGPLMSASEVQQKSAYIKGLGEADMQRIKAEVDAEAEAKHPDQATENAALLGAAATQLSRDSTYQRPSAYTPPASSYQSLTPVSAAPAVAPIRYAAQCVSFGHRTDAGSVGINVTNRCSQTITVWMRDASGLDYRVVNPGSVNWTTDIKRLDYACFVDPGQQICEK